MGANRFAVPLQELFGVPRGTQQIWRVNINDPSQHQKLYTYDTFSKWELSADAKAAIIQGGPGNGNPLHVFLPSSPPNSLEMTYESQDAPAGCNGSISPSGRYIAHFKGGAHVRLWFHEFIPPKTVVGTDMCSTEDMPAWPNSSWSTTVDIKGKQDWPRWSCNSDKWIGSCMSASLENGGTIGGSNDGTNQILVNWVDKIAIKTTYNKVGNEYKLDKKSEPRFWCTSGDFWVKGVPAGCYEDTTGAFIDALSKDVVPAGSVGIARPQRTAGPGASIIGNTQITFPDSRVPGVGQRAGSRLRRPVLDRRRTVSASCKALGDSS